MGDLGGLGGRAHDGLSSLPVEEKAVTWSWCALAMGFLLYLSRERPDHGLGVRLRWAFSLPVVEKALSWTSDGLSPLPVNERALSWTWCALAMGFSPCLSRKRPSPGLGVRLRWAFPPACQGKRSSRGHGARLQWHFSTVCRGKEVSGHPGIPQRGPERSPKVARELPRQKNIILF